MSPLGGPGEVDSCEMGRFRLALHVMPEREVLWSFGHELCAVGRRSWVKAMFVLPRREQEVGGSCHSLCWFCNLGG